MKYQVVTAASNLTIPPSMPWKFLYRGQSLEGPHGSFKRRIVEWLLHFWVPRCSPNPVP